MTPNEQYLSFFTCDEEHALPVLRVREILEYTTVTRLPAAPAWVRGVINLRGAVLPVVDLAARLGHAPSQPTRTTCIVVLETKLGEEMVPVGLLADAVSQVFELAADAIEPPPPFGVATPASLLVGMGKAEGRLVLVLDPDRILSAVEVAAVGTLEAPADGDPAGTAEILAPAEPSTESKLGAEAP
jgi:purine-binding chemotaxis protein CheW